MNDFWKREAKHFIREQGSALSVEFAGEPAEFISAVDTLWRAHVQSLQSASDALPSELPEMSRLGLATQQLRAVRAQADVDDMKTQQTTRVADMVKVTAQRKQEARAAATKQAEKAASGI